MKRVRDRIEIKFEGLDNEIKLNATLQDFVFGRYKEIIDNYAQDEVDGTKNFVEVCRTIMLKNTWIFDISSIKYGYKFRAVFKDNKLTYIYNESPIIYIKVDGEIYVFDDKEAIPRRSYKGYDKCKNYFDRKTLTKNLRGTMRDGIVREMESIVYDNSWTSYTWETKDTDTGLYVNTSTIGGNDIYFRDTPESVKNLILHKKPGERNGSNIDEIISPA